MFEPADDYGIRLENSLQSIQETVERGEIPSRSDVFRFRGGWHDSQCSRRLFPGYFPQVFGYGSKCEGTGRPDFIVVVAKKYWGQYGGVGTHVFCKSCLEEYIKRTGPYNKSKSTKGIRVLNSPERKIFVYTNRKL